MLNAENTVLVIIDIQTKLWNVMFEKEALLDGALKLVKGVQILGIPIVLTEQNPRGLGPTATELTQIMTTVQPIPKMCFSCTQDSGFRQALERAKRNQVLICGIEAHICVYQTALDLIESGYEVQVVADAVSSRSPRNRDIALTRLQGEGVKLTTTEMVLFELLKTAESLNFKEIQRIIK
ncbi:MAG TPA: hydrolase [Dehalococcoidales bacterium]